MKVAKETSEYTIFARNDGRYAVRGKDKKYVNGAEKVKILMAEGLAKLPAPSPPKASADATVDGAQEPSADA